MKKALLIAAVLGLVSAAVPAHAAVTDPLRTDFTASDARTLLDIALGNGMVKAELDKRAPAVLEIAVAGSASTRFTYNGGVSNGGGSPDYTISAARDIGLSLVNVDPSAQGKLLACLVAQGYVAISPASAAEQAGINAAKSQFAKGLDCSFGVGNEVRFRGLVGKAQENPGGAPGTFLVDLDGKSDYLVVNKFGAPDSWKGRDSVRLSGNTGSNTGGITKVTQADIDACKAAVLAHFKSQIKALEDKQQNDPWNAGGDASKLIAELQKTRDAKVAECDFLAGGVHDVKKWAIVTLSVFAVIAIVAGGAFLYLSRPVAPAAYDSPINAASRQSNTELKTALSLGGVDGAYVDVAGDRVYVGYDVPTDRSDMTPDAWQRFVLGAAASSVPSSTTLVARQFVDEKPSIEWTVPTAKVLAYQRGELSGADLESAVVKTTL